MPDTVYYLSTAHRDTSASSTVNNKPSFSSMEVFVLFILTIVSICNANIKWAKVTTEVREHGDFVTKKWEKIIKCVLETSQQFGSIF